MTAGDMRACAGQWLRSARAMETLRQGEMASGDTATAILLLEDAYLYAMKTYDRPLSGLVEMRRYFKRLRP
ncbi:MAG TPA: hypothetical protein PKK31_10235 [Elusimicrobiales bacterium]|jgi:hypothetical protein|nr:hypothetical protein [Elusimicrobiales bacterium]